MKFQFDSSLDFQQDAVRAIVDVFYGQAAPLTGAAAFQALQIGGLFQNELGSGNQLTLTDEQILSNVRRIQEANDIEKVSTLAAREFSVEMETGTGKTYVYLRTIFELSMKYKFQKFIVVVPSVAIREGVLKSIKVMKSHFQALYDSVPFDYFVYDSKRLDKVRQFASSYQIQIMIINIQAFVKDVPDKSESQMTEDEIRRLNVINRENDRMSGLKPIQFIRATNPVVIIDEPQSVDNTNRAKSAIHRLNPLATLRYSATHRNPCNLLYKLDPIKAYDLRLVKRIEVASIRSDDSFNDAFVKLIKTDNSGGIKAQVEIHKEGPKGLKLGKIWVKRGDDLFVKSKELAKYEEGYIIHSIDCTPGAEKIEFNSGRSLNVGNEIGGFSDDVMKAQVFETVQQHLTKELEFRGKGIKVLSLFFIDKVANYRIYNDDNTTSLGKIGRWFEEAYSKLTKSPEYKCLTLHKLSEVHDGYFSQDKDGRSKDTRGNTKDDEDTYNLIMRDKERLLDETVPLRFIFSHSALREGWDNPNVFQICTLNETQSGDKKRQEIGRGLRLPVNKNGERVHDDETNRLTVIANESYDEFARGLQSEFEDDFGIQFGKVEKIAFSKLVRIMSDGSQSTLGQLASTEIWQELVSNGYLNSEGKILNAFDPNEPSFNLKISEKFSDLKAEIIDEVKSRVFKNRIVNARTRRHLKFHKSVHLNDDFIALWDRIKHRTRYRVKFQTEELVNKAIARINKLEPIAPPRIGMSLIGLEINRAGVKAEGKLDDRRRVVDTDSVMVLPDILAFLQSRTELTRCTLVQILRGSKRLDDFRINPQSFMEVVAQEISRALHDLMLGGVQYDKIPNQQWEMSRIEREAEEGIVRYLNNLYVVQNQQKAIFDMIEYDSEVERQFARDLDANKFVSLFVKLPRWFKIDTPIGPYNPDWAFVTTRRERLYFVRETKSSNDSDDLRSKEEKKVKCGQKHFDTLGVDYSVVTSLSDVSF